MKQLARAAPEGPPLRDVLGAVLDEAAVDGPYAMEPLPELAMPRLYELAGAVTRRRSLRVRQAR